MKRSTIAWVVLLAPLLLAGQDRSARNILEHLPISIAVPANSEYLDNQQLQRIGTKTKQVMAANGLGAEGSGLFVLYPTFDLLQVQSMDGLANNITVVEAEITFTIKQLDNGIVFNSGAITVTSNGNSKKDAVNHAINQIKPSDNALKDFITESKARLLDYYTKKCGTIINDAIMLTDAKQYAKAISLLSSIPSDMDCYENARQKILDAYLNYQEQYCHEWLNRAKAYEAANNYGEALNSLSKIDPLSSCGNELAAIMKRIGKNVDEQDRRLWEAMERRYSDRIALEEMRMEMTRDILTEYYRSQQSDTYQLIFIR